MTAFSTFWAAIVGGGILGFAIAFMPWPKWLARKDSVPKKATVKYWAIIAGVGTVGLAMAFGPWPEWLMLLRVTVPETSTWVDLIRKVGEALFIGALLAILLDSPIKEKLLTEFAKDVSVHIIGESLPTRLREHLRDYLEMYCVRRNWKITYTMRSKPVGDRHYVELTIQSDYDIENRASEPRDYHFSIELEKTWYKEAGESRITKLDLGPDGKFDWETLRKHARYKPTSAVEFFSVDMELPPFPAHVSGEGDGGAAEARFDDARSIFRRGGVFALPGNRSGDEPHGSDRRLRSSEVRS